MMRQYLLAHLRVIIPVGLLAVMSLSVVAGIGYLRAFPWQPHSVQGKTLANLTQYVNPFIGTAPADAHNGRRDDRGDTFPGATYPLGMVQWSPDTSSKLAGGYVYSDTQIDGFSLTHFSGRGCIVYQDIPFMPYLGDVTQSPVSDPSLYVARFSHSNEQAQPGYYRVGLPDLNTQVELTVTPHTGMGRFTFPATAAASLLINASGSINGVSAASVSLVPGQQEVIGSATSTIGCGHASYTIYFAARFDQAFSAYGVWNGANVTAGATSGAGASVGAYVTFDTSQQQIVMASVGISFVSVANAEDNLARENPQPTSQQFDALRQAANSAWNTRLNSILIGSATPSQLSVFYTALYHIFLQPNIFSDANGQYIGFDGKVHTVATGHAQYENISTWDGYRCQIALLALLAPSVASDIAQSLVNDAQQGDGHLPRWEQANSDSYGMVGDGADVYIATAYAFGATQFDTAGALYAMLNDQPKIREGLSNYLTLGYVAAATNPESVSITQEYSADDFAIAQFAQALGQTSVVQIYMQRAANWRHVMNNASGYVQPRDASGAWMSGFSPAGQSGFAEGDSAQYTWMAPFDWGALVSDVGGAAKMTARLDSFFTELNSDPTTMYAFMGNEPSFEVPWEYDFTHTPSDTQEVVRRIQLGLFADTPGGLPGNDDGGALSSWYIFSTLGLYPEIAGVGGFVVGSPLFSSAIVSLANGKTLTINAPAAAPGAPYVQALALNGRATSSLWQTWAAIKNGATYTYTLGASTSAWGTAPLDAPPLFLPPGVPKL